MNTYKLKKVFWTEKAKSALDKYCEYIAEESPNAAKKVRKEILKTTKSLSRNSSIYELDEYYPENPGNIRRFFRWSYRVVYQEYDGKVVILGVYHTSKNSTGIK